MNPLFDNRKPVQSLYTEEQVKAHVSAKYEAGMSLRKIANEYGNRITHADIGRILRGTFPVGVEKRRALNIPEVCITYGQKVKYVRQVPAWLTEAVQNLAALEAKANVPLHEKRGYTRAGKRVIYE